MAPFAVRISDDGIAEIDGEPLVAEPGQSVHDAVLDRLQQYAQQRATAVEATVTDGPGAAHFVLEVSPDGSSRLVDRQPEPTPAPAPTPAPTPASAVATAIARARAAATAPPPVPSRPLPPQLAQPVARINALVTEGRLEEASAEATALRETLTRSAGTEHPDALEARAMEAYLAHLLGDHREATVLALSVARILCGAGDPQAPAAVARATAAWQRLDDDRAIEIHGNELLHMWDRLHEAGRLTAADERLAHRVRRRLEAPITCV
ncbi:hypothetical protein [Streptomyces edwardsiae]|uniref:Tetratricopeptide repeat protein n=1 Tax=Streptomyces edwardsiae TaxID=3075527 RepID=A0ABU2QI45_9ACTN|nr:hypothetical protein [Streptomyces sp. DSM 41635]MDT0404080.1 hypothetical protein [Streptomyces sp. DSM 41635]